MTVFLRMVDATLIITPLILVVCALTPLIDKRYAAKGRYFLWMAVMAGLCLPFVNIPRPAFQIGVTVPEAVSSGIAEGFVPAPAVNDFTVIPVEPRNDVQNFIESEPITVQAPPPAVPAMDLTTLIPIVWTAGIILSLLYHIATYLLFRRFARRWSEPETDPDVIIAYHNEAEQMGIRRKPSITRCKGVSAPILAGYLKPAILLPSRDYSLDELVFIFRHELTHYKRRDLWYKLALVAMRSVYWFNPAVYLMAAQANKDIETVCDMEVVRGHSADIRLKYSEVVLSMAALKPARVSQLTTSFTGGKKMLKQRLTNIFKSNKRSGIFLFGIVGLVAVAACLLVGFRFIAPDEPPVAEVFTDLPEQQPEPEPLMQGAPTESTPTESIITPESELSENDTYVPPADINLSLEPGIPGDLSAATQDEAASIEPEQRNAEAIAFTRDFGIQNRLSTVFETHENLDELIALVYDEAVTVEREFDNVSALNISSITDSIRVTRGGDRLTVRYDEWIPNEYTFELNDGILTVEYNIPGHARSNRNSSSLNFGWLHEHLREMGVMLHPVEIIIPASMTLEDFNAEIVSGNIDINGTTLGTVEILAASGNITMRDSTVTGSLDMVTASGFITLRGSTVTGASDIAVASGSIRVSGNEFVGHVKIAAASGDISFEDCVFRSAEISTAVGNGSVRLSSSANNYNTVFSSVSGSLTYNGTTVANDALRNPNAAARLTLSSALGSFEIFD